MNSTKRNVGLLAACQAMLFTNNTTLVAINGLAGLATVAGLLETRTARGGDIPRRGRYFHAERGNTRVAGPGRGTKKDRKRARQRFQC